MTDRDSIEYGRDYGVTFTKDRDITTEYFKTHASAKCYEREMINYGWKSDGIIKRN